MFNTGRKSGTVGTGGRVEVLKKRHGAGHPSQQYEFYGGSRVVLTVIKPASIAFTTMALMGSVLPFRSSFFTALVT